MLAPSWKNVNRPSLGKGLTGLSICIFLKKRLLILASGNKINFKKHHFINYLEHTELLSKLDLQCEFGDDRSAPLLDIRR